MENTAGLVERLTAAARTARAPEADRDGHAYWALVEELAVGAGGEEPLRLGSALLDSTEPLEREVGCDLVARAADGHESVRAGAATALIALAGAETRADVLESLVTGLDRTEDPRALPVLLRLARHEGAGVRRGVAMALGSVGGGRSDGEAVRVLLRLTRDEAAGVRNWAAFSLGTQLDHDTADIRDALWRCAADEDAEVRHEGARGLARRHDPGAVPLVAHLLEADGPEAFLLEAAEVLGAPELLPALRAHGRDGAGTGEAVSACDPARRARIEGGAWAVVTELERLRPGIGAALVSPRHESVHHMYVTLRDSGDTVYDAAALLARADGAPTRAAELVLSDLAAPAGSAGSRPEPAE
ncbi:HEAT repeat domain-containing protein [Kitasatospora sp. NPDC056327]|uniref:HEAT repeat domain-containing protein n=1 Tax=Kitasatospora sp. NPDC056327 TaxID=3345785 RepID=UPI0035DA87A5